MTGNDLRTTFRACAVAIALVTAPAIATAEEPPKGYGECAGAPGDAEVSAAKGAFQAGQVSFNEADYDRAITYWEDAYRRDCTAHALLLNLARAYELNGQKLHAVTALRTFRERNPESSQDPQIQRRIDKLEEQIAADAQAAAKPEPAPVETAPPPPPPAESEPDVADGSPSRVGPIVLMSVGGAAFIGGGVGFLMAQSDVNTADEECPNRAMCPPGFDADAANKARNRLLPLGIVSIGGAAAGIGGLVWLLLQPNSTDEAATKKRSPTRRAFMSPELAPGYAGFSVQSSF